MIESLTAVAWAFSTVKAIAQSEPGKKFIESTIGKVAEKMTEAGIKKIGELRAAIVAKLQGNPAAVEALAKAEASGSEDDLRDVAAHLDMLQRKDPAFAKQIQSLVQEIRSCVVQGDDAMVQNINDQARGYQIKAETGSKVYFVEKMENPD
jgi:Tfp pilus tip-associated adhesin PilY1